MSLIKSVISGMKQLLSVKDEARIDSILRVVAHIQLFLSRVLILITAEDSA